MDHEGESLELILMLFIHAHTRVDPDITLNSLAEAKFEFDSYCY